MAKTTKQEVVPVKQGGELQKAGAPRALSPFEEMEHMFEEFFPRRWPRLMRWEWPSLPELPELRLPRTDLIDREDEVLVRAELPGVDKKDVDVTVTEDTVTIKAETKREEKEEKGDYYRREISQASFARTLALPADVDGTRAKASFKDGVLELAIPKQKKSKRHTITVT